MSFSAYIGGLSVVALVTASAIVTGVALRRRLVPAWRGPISLLASAVLALATILVVSEVLGLIGWYERMPLVAVTMALAGVATTTFRTSPPTPRRDEAVTADHRYAVPVAIASVTLTSTLWSAWTVQSLRQGMTDSDTITYHLPFAARFAHDGHITALHFVAPDGFIAFNPATTELLHGIGILSMRTDVLSPFVNLVWLAIALLAAWCIGRPFGAGATSITIVAALLTIPLLSVSQPGEAMNDIAVIALVLSAVAFLVHDMSSPGAVAVAAVASGLAFGSKLSAVGFTAAMTIGVIVVLGRQRRFTSIAAWVGPFALLGSFWYMRNLVMTGSPFPGIQLGPLSLPQPRAPLLEHYGYSVAHYATDVDVWRAAFRPGLDLAFGPTWPLVLVLGIAGLALALRRPPSAIARLAAVAGVASAFGYLLTPTTAFGLPGEPVLFAPNLRYLAPALLLGAALLPTLPWLAAPRRQAFLLVTVAFVSLGAQVATRNWQAWPEGYRRGGLIAAVLMLGGIELSRRFRPRLPSRRVVWVGALVIALVAVPIGWRVERSYLAHRYRTAGFGGAWAQSVDHTRIGFAGFFKQYPLYGRTLTNDVQYVGFEGSDHSFSDFMDCTSWRAALRSGRYRFVVTAPTFEQQRDEPPQAAWTRSIAGAVEVVHDGPLSVFRLDEPPDPDTCD